MSAKTVEEYLQRPYTIEVIRDDNLENPGWVARVVELSGCMTQGDNFADLGEMIEAAMRSWIEVALEDGVEIPEPRREEEFSGKFIVRVPKSLHRRLAKAAEREDVSLNQFVNTSLAAVVGLPSKQVSSSPEEGGLAVLGLERNRLEPNSVYHLAKRAGAIIRLALGDFPTDLQNGEESLRRQAKIFPKRIGEEQGQYHQLSNAAVEGAERYTSRESDALLDLLLVKIDALLGLGHFDQALDVLNQAQKLYPAEIIFYRYAAALLRKLDRLEEALDQFHAARKAKVRFDPPSRDLERKIKAELAESKW